MAKNTTSELLVVRDKFSSRPTYGQGEYHIVNVRLFSSLDRFVNTIFNLLIIVNDNLTRFVLLHSHVVMWD